MKIKKIWTLILLLAISCSLMNANAFSAMEEDSCSVPEHTQEHIVSSDCDDICDMCFECQQNYLLPIFFMPAEFNDPTGKLSAINERIKIDKITSIFKPPIFS